MSAPVDTIVIGGGITGLSCTFRLLKAGASALVIDAANFGGLVRTECQSGFTLECGPNVVLAKPDLLRLVAEAGLEKEIVYPIHRLYRQHVWHEGRVERVPKDPLSLIKTPLMAGADKRQLLRRLFLDPLPRVEQDDCSIADFLRPVVGEKAVSALLAPALQGIYGGSVYELSARTVFPGLWQAAKDGLRFPGYLKRKRRDNPRARIFTLRGGLSLLATTLEHYCGERAGIKHGRVIGLEKRRAGFAVCLDDSHVFEAKNVIVTTSGPSSAVFLSKLDPSIATRLSSLEYIPLVVVHLSVPRETGLPEKSFGVLFPREKGRNLLGAMFNSLLFPHVAPPGRHLITVMLGGSAGKGVIGMTDGEILNSINTELKATLGVADSEMLRMTRWKAAIPRYEIGHFRLTEALEEVSRKNPGLFFAGTDLGLPGIADRVKTASRVAGEV